MNEFFFVQTDINTNDGNPTEPTSSFVVPIGNGVVEQSICNDVADKTMNQDNANNGIVYNDAKSIDPAVDADAEEPANIENSPATDNINEQNHGNFDDNFYNLISFQHAQISNSVFIYM